MSTQGRRREPKPDGFWTLDEGEYLKDDAGEWWARPPGTKFIGALTDHTIEEHEDGTISVTPSILVPENLGTYHGYLTRGVWTDSA